MTQDISSEGAIFATRSDLKKLGIHLSNTQLLRLEAVGRFPRRVRLSAGTVSWILEEILEWIEKKSASALAMSTPTPRHDMEIVL